MKITEVEALYLRLPQIQARTDSSQDALIVKVSTDAGITGWGEVDGCPYVTKAIIEAPMSHTLVTGLRELLLGEDPLEIGRVWRKMYQGTLYYGREGAVLQAMAGIDLALWDIKGKALGQPVYKLLGGGFRKQVRAYASNMFQFTAEATAERAGRRGTRASPRSSSAGSRSVGTRGPTAPIWMRSAPRSATTWTSCSTSA